MLTGKDLREIIRVNGVELSRVANALGISENTIFRVLRKSCIPSTVKEGEYMKAILKARQEKCKELRAMADKLDGNHLIGQWEEVKYFNDLQDVDPNIVEKRSFGTI